MKRLADHTHPLVIETAARLTGCATTSREKFSRLFEYVRDDVKFRFPEDGDFVSASDTIRLGYGQCNTKATLLLALCGASGIPARIHFSLISKEIQKGFFTGILYWLLPKKVSHSWIEVEMGGRWRHVDTFINDLALLEAAQDELKKRNWSVGFSVAMAGEKVGAGLDLDKEEFQQMAAVTDDHGVWDDPADYYASSLYNNRPGVIRLWIYRRIIGVINARVDRLRQRKLREGVGA